MRSQKKLRHLPASFISLGSLGFSVWLATATLFAAAANAQQNTDPIYDPNVVAAEENLGEPDVSDGSADETADLLAALRDDAEADTVTEPDSVTAQRPEAAQPAGRRRETRDLLDRNRSRRISRRLEQDYLPSSEIYAPLGIKRGSFLLFPEISLGSFYSDNIFQTAANPQSDHGLELRSGLQIRSDWSRHALEVDIRGERQFLDRFDEEAEREFSTRGAARIDIRERTQLEARSFFNFSTESRDSQELPDGAAERTKTRDYGGDLTLSHRFNRLTLALRGGAATFDYDDVRLNNGTIANNDDRDYTERFAGLRASYEFSPALTAFADISANDRRFKQAVDDDGFRRGSKGLEFASGITLTVSEKLRGGLTVGYARQKERDPRLKDLAGLIFEADLEYRPSALTTISLRAASELDETVIAGSAGSVLRVVELDIAHALRRHFVALLGVSFGSTDYQGIALDRQELALRAGADYYFAREAALSARFEHTKSSGNDPDDDYSVNEFRLGLKLRR